MNVILRNTVSGEARRVRVFGAFCEGTMTAVAEAVWGPGVTCDWQREEMVPDEEPEEAEAPEEEPLPVEVAAKRAVIEAEGNYYFEGQREAEALPAPDLVVEAADQEPAPDA